MSRAWSDGRRGRAAWLDRQVVRFLAAQGGRSTPWAVALVAALLGLSWALLLALGGAGHVAPHWFYIPIVLAGVRFGLAGAAAAALASGLLAGPLTPADVATGAAQPASDWGLRAVAFLTIGLAVTCIGRMGIASLTRELDLARRELELSARRAAIIASVSHEFRTPLTIIEGVSRTLSNRLDGEDERSLVDGLERAAKRLDDLVGSVLLTAEGLEGVREHPTVWVDVGSLCGEVLEDLADLRAGERVHVGIGSEDVRLWTSPEMLRHALRHLIENALKYSPPEEPVDVRVGRERGDVLISVRDRGPGVPPDLLERVEAFVQADPSSVRPAGGIGLGLFAVHTLTGQLGGRLELRRHPEGGTVAVVRLPARRTADRRPVATP